MKILDNPRSGSYAGVTSSRNRNGQYVRNRSIPVNPSSTFQQAVRARLTTNSQDWRSLTSAQRAGWNDLGNQMLRSDSLGQTSPLTGFQAFLSINNNKLAAGDAKLTDAPLYLPPDPMLTITPTVTSGAFSIAYTTTPLPAGARVFVSVSPQRSAGRTFEGDYRLIAVSAAAAASPLNILAAYTARFGVPVTGGRVFISVQQYLNGFLSQPLNTTAVVA